MGRKIKRGGGVELAGTSYKIIIGMFAMFLLLGISYALFTQSFIGEKSYSITSGNLKVYLDEESTASIALTNVIPVSDEDGIENEAYRFSLANEEKEDLEYTIYLKEEDFENKTPSSAIRYNYTRDIDQIDVTRNLEENRTETGRYYLEAGIIPSKTRYNYEFRMWIDYKAGNEIMGTQYSVRLEIEAAQTIKIYQEEILNECDPVLSDNLIPVVIENNGVVKKASVYKEWYKYSEQKWANAVVLEDASKKYKSGEVIPEANIESYFVWIPKFRYQLWNLGEYSQVTNVDPSQVHVIPIEFGVEDTDDSNEGECTTPGVSGESGNCKVGDYMTHPAFQAFDSKGFWVGKFESGYKGATTTNMATVNSSDSSKLMIKPNVYSWRGITLGNAFKVSYDYMRNEESHMIKNTEWGAVAYLQHSNYGSRMSVRINNNPNYITGYSAVTEPTCGVRPDYSSAACNAYSTDLSVTQPYNTTVGGLASTTGNITGIYDMSGGSLEFVMGYNSNASSIGGSSGITEIYGDFFSNSQWEKYYDRYDSKSLTDFKARILGDATGEMGPFEPYGSFQYSIGSWYHDEIILLDAENSWIASGSWMQNGHATGIFASGGTSYGSGHPSYSFRTVLVP